MKEAIAQLMPWLKSVRSILAFFIGISFVALVLSSIFVKEILSAEQITLIVSTVISFYFAGKTRDTEPE